MSSANVAAPRLEIRLLGELEVLVDGAKLALPQSKKTRALLGYLVLTGQQHRRERLCALLWDVADDPRAALRWSLSKLRELVDLPERKCLQSDREHVALDTSTPGLYVDALELTGALGPSADLHALRALFRGELLEGLELADFHGFSAWLVAERARFRALHRRILDSLIEHSGGRPQQLLPLIRELVDLDPSDEAARAKLLEVLHATGAIGEAHEQARANQRLVATPLPLVAATEHHAPPEAPAPTALLGREAELASLQRWLSNPAAKLRAFLIEGEAGLGKSELLRAYERTAAASGARCVRVRVPDARPGWPYAALQALLRKLDGASDSPLEQPPPSREQLMQAVKAELERALHAHSPLLLLLDDVHFLDAASIELLHFCALELRTERLAFVLSARSGELHDRPSIARTLRVLRRERLLEELRLAPLTLEQTESLVATRAHGRALEELHAWSGGNPLFAQLLCDDDKRLPSSLTRLVHDRVASLPPEQSDLLRWAALLGAQFRTDFLLSLVGLDADAFVEALEALERHGWLSLRSDASEQARFAHQVVQRALYDQLSEPRKRMMHMRVAQLLAAQRAETSALELTAMLAHHAIAGGDRSLAVRACLAAGRRCLRVYAHADALSLARRGLAQVPHMPEPEQITLALELWDLLLRAQLPDDPDTVLPELVRLTERALDLGAIEHARRGFQLRAYVKWQLGQSADALHYSRELERITRLSSPSQRAEALADSARCLAQLERDLPDAEAFLLEAEALAGSAEPPATLPLARGILTLFQGDYAHAERDLERARQLAAHAGNRLEEFYSLEFRVYLELARAQYSAALTVCGELLSSAERLRGGSEQAFARTLQALAAALAGDGAALDAFDAAYAQLAAQDAKQRCAFLSAEAARFAAERGDSASARKLAERALSLAAAIDRTTESALALSVLVSTEPGHAQNIAALRACIERPVSAIARQRALQALEQESKHGNRDRRTRLRTARGS